MALKEENLISCSSKIRTGQRLVKVGSTFMPVGIGGATPPDTSDASATADDILKDKTAYAGNDLIQGTIPSKDAETFIPGTADQIIEKKQYLAGDQIIRGDAALIPENIIKGASIFGVEGAFSGGGNFYQATGSNVPQSIPTNGLVFYAPLYGESPEVVKFGQNYTVLAEENGDASQTVKYVLEDGIPCAAFGSAANGEGSAYTRLVLYNYDNYLPYYGNVRSMSFWVKFKSHGAYFFNYGYYSSGNLWGLYADPNKNTILFTCHGDDVYPTNCFDLSDRMHHVAVVQDGSTNRNIRIYIDGVEQELTVVNDRNITTTGSTPAYIGGGRKDNPQPFDGWMSSIRFYNRVLTPEEITALASESFETQNATWSGQKLVQDEDGNYTVSGNVKNDLEITGITPEIGKVYLENTTMQVYDYWNKKMPTDTAFNIPLDDVTNNRGQLTPYEGFGSTWSCPHHNYVTLNKELAGVKCLYLQQTGKPYITSGNIFAEDDTTANESTGCSARYGAGYPWTYSFWFYPDSTTNVGHGDLFTLGYSYSSGWDRRLRIAYNDTDGTFQLFTDKNNSVSSGWYGYAEKQKWHHVCVTAEANARTFKLYVDGKYTLTLTHGMADIPAQKYTNPCFYLGAKTDPPSGDASQNAVGGIAKLKWFNRVLHEGEIAALADEIKTA